MTTSTIDSASLASFHAHLNKSTRILALLGAGLSASSGLPTFRGAGGLWRTHDSTSLATPEAFHDDPALVWQFYEYRRQMALSVDPNPAHYALAELARKVPGFQALSQNVDGLSQRAEHPPKQLHLLHGTLFDIQCSDRKGCGYSELNFNRTPITPALAIPTSGVDATSNQARMLDISDINVPLQDGLGWDDLPSCPKCKDCLMRPGVVWFGESLPPKVLQTVGAYLRQPEDIDLMLVIGTSAQVQPAAGYIDAAQNKGARICVVNMDEHDKAGTRLGERDWFFRGDAAVIVPELLEPLIGKVTMPSTT